MNESDLEKLMCECLCDWFCDETKCEDCGDVSKLERAFFLSDGGCDAREGTYLCKACFRGRMFNIDMLNRSQMDAVEMLKWAMVHFSGLQTNRQCRRSTVISLVKVGIAESIGMGEVCDGDGFILEGRKSRECFRLTKYGLIVHSHVMDWYGGLKDRKMFREVNK